MTRTTRRRLLGAGAAALGLTRLGAAQEPAVPAQQPEGEPQPLSTIGRTPHTRFAVNVEMWWTRLPFLERLRQAAALGFPAVEFWPWRNKDVDAVAGLCAELGLEVAQFTAWGFVPGMNDPANHEAFLAEVEASCVTAKQLSCKCMTVVGGDDQPGMTQAEMHAHIVTGLQRAAPIAEAADVTLILEPMNVRVDHQGHSLYGSEAGVKICRAVGSKHVKLNWDLYHMQISEGDLCGHLRDGYDQLGYLQLADHPGRHEPGTGEVHYPRVLRQAYELGYRGFVGLECTPLEGEELAARRVAAADRW